jgi:membrane protease YdiL (CAAX protease family)
MSSGAYPFEHPGPPPELPELPEGAPPPRHPPRRQPVTPWPPWTAPVALIAGFGLALFGATIISLIGTAIAGGDVSDPPGGVIIAATIFQDAALVGSAVLLARLTSNASGPWHFGLRRPRFWPALGWLIVAYVSFLLLTGGWLVLMQALGVNVDQNDELPKELGADANTYALVIVGLLVTVVAPIAEEIFFRGYFFTALRNWKGVPLAAIITGAVFGAIHIGSSPPVFLVPLAMFGVLLCLLYWRTNSLLPCITLHCVNNCVAFGVSQDYSWQIPLIVVGALTLIGAILLPLTDRGRPAGIGSATS